MTDADARGSEPVTRNGVAIGRTTSGGYGWRTGKSLALAMVKPEFRHWRARSMSAFSARPARGVIADSPYDPKNAALKA